MATNDGPASPAPDLTTERRAYRPIVLSVCFAAFMASLDAYIVNVSLPAIARDFQVSLGHVAKVMLAYLLSLAACTLIMGRLADRVGHKRLFLVGYGVFTFASLLCGTAPVFAVLIFARFLQGIGSCMLVITAYALLPHYLPTRVRGWGFGLLSVTSALGVTVGAPLGGLLTGYLSWHWVFLVNLPIGVAAMLYARRGVPPDPPKAPDAPAKPFDYPGAVMSFLATLGLVFAINNGHEFGWRSPMILGGFGLALVFTVLLLLWERRCAEPLLDLQFLVDPRFITAMLACMAAMMVLSGNSFLMPFYLEMDRGTAPQMTGLILMAYSIVFMMVGPRAGRLSDRVPPSLLCAAGMLAGAGGCAFFAFCLRRPGLWVVLLFLVWLGVSFGLFMSPNNNRIMGLAPEGRHGSVSGVFNLFNRLSMVIGVGMFEMLFSAMAPVDICQGGTAATATGQLEMAFRATYLIAGGLCLLSAILSFLSLAQTRGEARPAGRAGEAGQAMME